MTTNEMVDLQDLVPVAKRVDNSGTSSRVKSFLSPIRSLGRIYETSVPPTLYHRGGMWFSAMATGDSSFSVVALDTLDTCFSGSRVEGKILKLASREDTTLVLTSGDSIFCYERGECLWEQKVTDQVLNILLYEDFFILISSNGVVEVRSCRTGQLNSHFKISIEAKVTHCIHPNTLMNKILVGFEDGNLELWNIKSHQKIYSFKAVVGYPITYISQSPDADICAVAFADGTLVVMDIKTEREVGRVKCATSIVSAAFRFDSPPEDTQMMTAEGNGLLTIWSVKGRARPIGQLKIHEKLVSASFLTGQPIIVTFGDNSVKEWILEAEGHELRLLRSREGPTHPISHIHFHDNELVTAGGSEAVISLSLGLDTKIYKTVIKSTVQESLGSKNKIASIDTFNLLPLGWDDGVLCIEGRPWVKTYCKRRNASGNHTFKSADNLPISCAKVSPCGHFSVIGSVGGLLSIFSMQSGLLRSSVQCTGTPLEIGFNSVCRQVIALSTSGLLVVINVKTRNVEFTEQFLFGVQKAQYRPESGLLFMLTDDFNITVYDVEGKSTVRQLEPADGIVSCMAVSGDGKWLLSGSSSGSMGQIVLWDMASGLAVALHKLAIPPRCLAISNDDEFVAVVLNGHCHAELFWFLPHAGLSCLDAITSAPDSDDKYLQLRDGSISRWLTLVNWQQLCEQNKPKVPLKKSSSAPFFLSELAAAKPLGVDGADSSVAGDNATNGPEHNHEWRQLESLLQDNDHEQAKHFFSRAPANAIHQELSLLREPEHMRRLSALIAKMSVDPGCFDRTLAILKIIFSRVSGLDEECVRLLTDASNNLSSHWQHSSNALHASLNAIRFTKGRQYYNH